MQAPTTADDGWTTSDDVMRFWRDAGPSAWFTKDAAFDRRFHDRFLGTHFAAARRELDAWAATADGALALLILLDQFPRNAFRGTAHMFATDPLARLFAQRLVDAGFDQQTDAALRIFCYLPFEHSEAMADQEISLRLHLPLGEQAARYAVDHHRIIQRFGRFPHRNAALGRETTREEAAFLQAGGFSG